MTYPLDHRLFETIGLLTRRDLASSAAQAARKHLLEGVSQSDAARSHGIGRSNVRDTAIAITDQYKLICAAYGTALPAAGSAPAISGSMFDAIAKLTRRDAAKPTTMAARLVVVDGLRPKEAEDRTGASSGNVSNAVSRIREAHSQIWSALGGH
ncbi:hypothetical protein [Marinobacter sp.]|uniref:hypothetical protein n=1 Tax=Marinobacter sp. TaxID=50741 RepID=UPI003A8EE088